MKENVLCVGPNVGSSAILTYLSNIILFQSKHIKIRLRTFLFFFWQSFDYESMTLALMTYLCFSSSFFKKLIFLFIWEDHLTSNRNYKKCAKWAFTVFYFIIVHTSASIQFSVTTRYLILTHVVAWNEFRWEKNCSCQLRHDLATFEAYNIAILKHSGKKSVSSIKDSSS